MSDQRLHVELDEQLWVDANNKSEIEYLHSQFPWLSNEEITTAVNKAGPLRKDIEEYLSKIHH